MTKYLFFFILCGFLAAKLNAQTLLSENFNNGFPAGWQNIDVDGLTPVPQVAYCGNAFGVHVDFDSIATNDSILVATSWFTPVGTANNYLITPQITLLGNGNFIKWQAKSKDPSYPDGYMILVSTTTNNIAAFTDTLFNTTAELPNWTNRQKNLDAYAGQPIYIAFRHYANNKFILALDNIEVYADITFSVEQNNLENNFKIYPNPTNGVLHIEIIAWQNNPFNNQYKIYDISGKLISTADIKHQKSIIELNHLQNGVYYIQIITPAGLVNKKFIVAK